MKQLSTAWFKDEYKEIIFFAALQFDYEENENIASDIPNANDLKEAGTHDLTEL